MKKYFTLILFSLLFFSSDIYSQWYSQYYSTGHFVLDIRFVNRNTGWACGSSGAILKTTNSGKEWIRHTTSTTAYLTGIFPVNDSVVYACGWYCILKTVNGGVNWSIVRIGTNQVGELWCLWFLDENTGWFAGDRVMIRTIDGCESFIDSMYIPASVAEDIHFKNYYTGLISGGVGSMGTSILRTTNSGTDWYDVFIPHNQFQPYIYRMSFILDTGYAASRTRLFYHSTNYGISWDTISRIPMNVGEGVYCVDFSSTLTGYCGGDFGKMYKSTNGGYNWYPQNTTQFAPGPFGSIDCFNDSVVWAVGGSGSRYIINTTNGGEILTDIKHMNNIIENVQQLSQNYPNPFNSWSIIKFSIQKFSNCRIIISNIKGNDLITLTNKQYSPGEYELPINSDNLSSGIYYYRMEINSKLISVRKLIILK